LAKEKESTMAGGVLPMFLGKIRKRKGGGRRDFNPIFGAGTEFQPTKEGRKIGRGGGEGRRTSISPSSHEKESRREKRGNEWKKNRGELILQKPEEEGKAKSSYMFPHSNGEGRERIES